jgi:glycosyltransferase involved in cell wall biosynthesis
MISVGLVTTLWTSQRCGVAEYGRMLSEALDPEEVQITPIGGPYDVGHLLPRVAGKFDIVHFNYESGFLGIFNPGVAQLFGPRRLLTLHDHWPRNNRERYPFVDEFPKVVVHHETGDGLVHIPHGIPLVDQKIWSDRNSTIGQAGFPLAQKRMVEVAEAAALLKAESPRITGCTMVCPESGHVNTHEVQRQVLKAFPATQYITDWLPQWRVMEILATNLVNVYPMKDGKSGVSASVRMGLGTGSHMVLSRCDMFRDLYDEKYENEIEWIVDPVTPRTIADAVLRVIDNGKRPKRILEDMAWPVVAKKYTQLYRELMTLN